MQPQAPSHFRRSSSFPSEPQHWPHSCFSTFLDFSVLLDLDLDIASSSAFLLNFPPAFRTASNESWAWRLGRRLEPAHRAATLHTILITVNYHVWCLHVRFLPLKMASSVTHPSSISIRNLNTVIKQRG